MAHTKIQTEGSGEVLRGSESRGSFPETHEESARKYTLRRAINLGNTATDPIVDRVQDQFRQDKERLERAASQASVAQIEEAAITQPPVAPAQDGDLTLIRQYIQNLPEIPRGEG